MGNFFPVFAQPGTNTRGYANTENVFYCLIPALRKTISSHIQNYDNVTYDEMIYEIYSILLCGCEIK